MIRFAGAEGILDIERTYLALFAFEEKEGGFSNWQKNVYPTVSVPQKRVPMREMYVLEEGGVICGSMVLNREQAEEYQNVPWQYPAPAEQVLVLHTLCIPPGCAGTGTGRKWFCTRRSLPFATATGSFASTPTRTTSPRKSFI